MWLTRVLRIVRNQEPIIKKHTNEYTGFQVQTMEKNDKSWGRRKVKMMTAHLYGRRKIFENISSDEYIIYVTVLLKEFHESAFSAF